MNPIKEMHGLYMVYGFHITVCLMFPLKGWSLSGTELSLTHHLLPHSLCSFAPAGLTSAIRGKGDVIGHIVQKEGATGWKAHCPVLDIFRSLNWILTCFTCDGDGPSLKAMELLLSHAAWAGGYFCFCSLVSCIKNFEKKSFGTLLVC